MENEEIYALFRAQDKYLKFGDFLEYCICWEEEDEIDMGILHEESRESDSNTGAGQGELGLDI